MNRRILYASIAVCGLLVLSAAIWVPPLLNRRQAAETLTATPAPPTATPTPAPPETHDLRVLVRDADTASPIASATVLIGPGQGKTDAAGSHTASIAHGQTTPVQVHAPGYETWEGSADTTSLMDADIVLDVSLTANTVRGQVVGIELTPLPEAQVTFRGQPVAVDDEGRFSLRKVVAGDEVSATHPAHTAGTAVSNDYPTLYLVLDPIEMLVHVRDAMRGVDVPDASVCIQERCSTTDAEGRAVVLGVPPVAELSVTRQGYQAAEVTQARADELTIEVIPFARRAEQIFLESIGGSVTLRVDENESAFRTHQKNLILDAHFGQISDPIRLASRLNTRAGIVEHGLFLGLVTDVIVAPREYIRHLRHNTQTS